MAWFRKVIDDLVVLPDMVDHYEAELIEARKELKLSGKLEVHSSLLSSQVENRFNQLQDIEAVLEFLNVELRKTRSKIFRKYLETYQRALSSRDAEKYVDGEKEVVELANLVNEVSFLRNQYLGIMKGLDVKGWQISNVTKLRSVGLDDVTV